MRASRHSRALLLLTGSAAAILGMGVAAWLIAWTGLYSVAASRGHLAVVEWFLDFGLRNSVETHAIGIDVPRLDDDALVQLGAVHFDRGCAICHGAPGAQINQIAQQMLPPPSQLATAVRRWTDAELFWIVQHGIKYTGMPGWPALDRADEVWSIVAFLRELPRLDPARYRALAGIDSSPLTQAAPGRPDGVVGAAAGCGACHGTGGELPRSSLVPVLHRQPEKMLLGALNAFASGRRRSGIMQPIAASLPPETTRAIASYYAALPAPRGSSSAAPGTALANGRRLATAGLPEKGVPPCMACHGSQALAEYPRLAGQHARYMEGRLRRWQDARPLLSDGDALMAPIARRLSASQVADVSAYFASLPVDSPGESP